MHQPSCFQHSKVSETGLCDFHLLTVTDRNYKKFNNKNFPSNISKINLRTTDLQRFKKTVFRIFNKYSPIERK